LPVRKLSESSSSLGSPNHNNVSTSGNATATEVNSLSSQFYLNCTDWIFTANNNRNSNRRR